jgi:N-acetylated-alpha-linked acidic dipeptidase
MLASWEGEELGALGSKAWLKDNISSLNSSLVAYLNVVVAGAGSKFHAVGSPLLTNVLHLASESAPLPGQNVDYWDGTIATGSGGDANVFQSSYCFSTLDFGFTSKPGDPVFPYHSLFDSEDWMDRFGDPDREYHKVIVKLWLSLASLLADSLILPILAADYAKSMKDMVKEIRMRATSTSKLDLGPLETAIESFHKACAVHDAYSHSLTPLSSQKLPKKSVLNQIREVNHKYIMLERFFADPEKTSQEGNRNLVLPTGSYYIKRPGFPQLTQLIEQNNWPEARVCVPNPYYIP